MSKVSKVSKLVNGKSFEWSSGWVAYGEGVALDSLLSTHRLRPYERELLQKPRPAGKHTITRQLVIPYYAEGRRHELRGEVAGLAGVELHLEDDPERPPKLAPPEPQILELPIRYDGRARASLMRKLLRVVRQLQVSSHRVSCGLGAIYSGRSALDAGVPQLPGPAATKHPPVPSASGQQSPLIHLELLSVPDKQPLDAMV